MNDIRWSLRARGLAAAPRYRSVWDGNEINYRGTVRKMYGKTNESGDRLTTTATTTDYEDKPPIVNRCRRRSRLPGEKSDNEGKA